MRSARLMVHSLHPGEIARLLESLPLQERAVLWEMVSPDDEGDILVELSDEVRDGLIEGMQTEELIAATAGMDFDDLADLLADLPEAVTRQVLQSLDKLDHDRLQQVLAYDEDCAGGLMNIDIVTVRPDVTLEVVMRYLRAVGEMPDGTDLLFVVNRDNEYVGSLFLSRLLTHDPDTLVSGIMSTDVLPILNHIFGLGTLSCPDSGDIDDSGSLQVNDPVLLLNYLFQSGADPASPFPTAGSDPTADPLGCVMP